MIKVSFIIIIKSKGKHSNFILILFPKGSCLIMHISNLSLMMGYDSGLEISINRETWHKQGENSIII